jgi:hypothetical protein
MKYNESEQEILSQFEILVSESVFNDKIAVEKLKELFAVVVLNVRKEIRSLNKLV